MFKNLVKYTLMATIWFANLAVGFALIGIAANTENMRVFQGVVAFMLLFLFVSMVVGADRRVAMKRELDELRAEYDKLATLFYREQRDEVEKER